MFWGGGYYAIIDNWNSVFAEVVVFEEDYA